MRTALIGAGTIALLGLEAFTAWLAISGVPDAGYVLLMQAACIPLALADWWSRR